MKQNHAKFEYGNMIYTLERVGQVAIFNLTFRTFARVSPLILRPLA